MARRSAARRIRATRLLLDGVDTSDPEGGTAWTFFNYNIIDEVQVGSLGQPAEYGGFTGAVVNTITKSGGNRYSSLFEYRYTDKGLRGDNISDEVKPQNPTLAASGVDKLNDYTVQLGGPIRRDKVFFFGSIQRYSIEQDPDGPAHHPDRGQPTVQHQAHVPANGGRQHHPAPSSTTSTTRPVGPGSAAPR